MKNNKLSKYQQGIYNEILSDKLTFYADENELKCWYLTSTGLKITCRYGSYLGLLRKGKLILKKHFLDMPLDCMVFEYGAL